MKKNIINHLNEPGYLEKLYRNNKTTFVQTFNAMYPEIKGNPIADSWYSRLNYNEGIRRGVGKDIIFISIISLVAGCIARIPSFFSIDEDYFYQRNIGFIIFPALTAYFARKNKLSLPKIVFLTGGTLLGLIFINLLPNVKQSDTLILSCIHLVLFLWVIMGVSFAGTFKNDPARRLGYLKYNGDLVVMTTLILIAGALLSAISIGLFTLIGIDIREFYFENIVIFLLPAAPIVATYLTQTNPELVGRVSPVIAKIFSPLVLIMLVVYLGAMIYAARDPFNDRDFLMIFNALLLSVMAIIFFSVAESSQSILGKAETWVLVLLSVVTVIVNGVALSAILFRISEYGFSPNRAAILGGNVLILGNLVLVTGQLFKVISGKGNIQTVGKVISGYLPIYFAWTIVVTFIFPVIFTFH